MNHGCGVNKEAWRPLAAAILASQTRPVYRDDRCGGGHAIGLLVEQPLVDGLAFVGTNVWSSSTAVPAVVRNALDFAPRLAHRLQSPMPRRTRTQRIQPAIPMRSYGYCEILSGPLGVSPSPTGPSIRAVPVPRSPPHLRHDDDQGHNVLVHTATARLECQLPATQLPTTQLPMPLHPGTTQKASPSPLTDRDRWTPIAVH